MSEQATIQAFYGRWARLYDLLARAPGIQSWRQQAVDVLDLRPGETVAEMGVGTGANLPFLRAAVGGSGRVVGLDLTEGMLSVARRRVARSDWTNVDLLHADAADPPVIGDIDAILGSFVVAIFDDPASVVGNWLDRLRPGGRLALLDATRSDNTLAAPLNLGFRAFVRLTAPGERPWTTNDPLDRLESGLRAADDALAAGTDHHDAARLAGGFIRLRWGEVPSG